MRLAIDQPRTPSEPGRNTNVDQPSALSASRRTATRLRAGVSSGTSRLIRSAGPVRFHIALPATRQRLRGFVHQRFNEPPVTVRRTGQVSAFGGPSNRYLFGQLSPLPHHADVTTALCRRRGSRRGRTSATTLCPTQRPPTSPSATVTRSNHRSHAAYPPAHAPTMRAGGGPVADSPR